MKFLKAVFFQYKRKSQLRFFYYFFQGNESSVEKIEEAAIALKLDEKVRAKYKDKIVVKVGLHVFILKKEIGYLGVAPRNTPLNMAS